MTDYCRDSSHSLKSEGTTSQSSEFGDYAVATIKSAKSTPPCRQCYLARENSVLENREGQGLVRSESVDITSFRMESSDIAGDRFYKQSISHTTSPNDVTISVDCEDIVTRNKAQGFSYGPPMRSVSTISVTREKRRNSVTRMNCLCHIFSICLSLMAVCGVGYVIYAAKNDIVQPVTPELPSLPHSLALQEQASTRVTGRFSLDQDAFIQSNKTQIRWKTAGSSDSSIIASPYNSCLTVPERGTYGVFSVLTFSIAKNDPVEKLAHFLKLEDYQIGEQYFQRKIFAVPVPENRNNPETKIPSTLISFVGMEANGRICIYTAEAVMKYMYVSPLDNTINIFKV